MSETDREGPGGVPAGVAAGDRPGDVPAEAAGGGPGDVPAEAAGGGPGDVPAEAAGDNTNAEAGDANPGAAQAGPNGAQAAANAPQAAPNALGRLVAARRVIICAGPGGVGKTTTAAAIAVHAAHLGRRACVVTIDPAKRLADALGLEGLSNEPRAVAGDWKAGGELWALMLDTKTTFDDVVTQNAPSAQQAQTILDNRLYRNISSALGGTQEYMAMEKLYELHHAGRFDLVVVDTPPTRRALDFLDAPTRLMRFLDNRVFRLLMTPTRAGLRALGMASHLLLRTIAKVVGGAVVADAVAFFAAFEGMEQGFRERAARVEELLVDEDTSFVVVASPRRDAVAEALYFADRLHSATGGVETLIVNRMFPAFGPPPTADGGRDGGGDAEGTRQLLVNMAELEQVASREERYVATLAECLPGTPVIRVPFLADDVHDVAGLREIGRWLFAAEGAAPVD